LNEKTPNYKDLSKLIESYEITQFIGIGEELYKNTKFFPDKYLIFRNESEFLKHFSNIIFKDHYILIKGKKVADFQKIYLKLEQKKHNTVLEINLSSLIKNLNYYRSLLAPKTKFLVMIKAAGYGTGLIESAKILEQNHIDYIGVAYTDEGAELRENGIKSPILVMNVEQKSMDNLIENRLTPSIYDLGQLDEFTKKLILMGIKNYPIHIKLNTGMNRMGFDSVDIKKLCSFLISQPEIKVEGIFSHLAASDQKKGKKLTEKQFDLFNSMSLEIESLLGIKTIKHILNTAGIENYPNQSLQMVRLGIGLYGVSKSKKLSNVASLVSRISKIRTVNKGDYIGYGVNNQSEKKLKVAIVPIGYADGFSRSLGNGKGRVFINNAIYPTIGNICMDMLFIDITNSNLNINDRVEIFGNNYSIFNMADAANTIPYEIISSISNRVVRVYQKD
jgi:alanine racemase